MKSYLFVFGIIISSGLVGCNSESTGQGAGSLDIDPNTSVLDESAQECFVSGQPIQKFANESSMFAFFRVDLLTAQGIPKPHRSFPITFDGLPFPRGASIVYAQLDKNSNGRILITSEIGEPYITGSACIEVSSPKKYINMYNPFGTTKMLMPLFGCASVEAGTPVPKVSGCVDYADEPSGAENAFSLPVIPMGDVTDNEWSYLATFSLSRGKNAIAWGVSPDDWISEPFLEPYIDENLMDSLGQFDQALEGDEDFFGLVFTLE